uniref:Superoxide dismutase copper/zinc binding domain-containing protein n=2 Tax=Choreotrichia TaxID=141411 RepID=A0A7S3MR79_9SPIT|mmetsp:Transcript_836/g.1266  ORF Transcript_836/g.1266 Transcript_836/m.1266 type:complete len:223 (+) Transcript_836:266-934(+)|eukprot:CAMPEP_0170463386 /NCGR_PEP_ID=MMETSP0123-20130129/8517_1 /TAXON_ID=182087 /ORGANISM="Favella ehrenbergii, Strain Fehren 1" /LENGTH=222 /DNA_ID=CAMNT_0010728805 /DNA_START=243 /DNA_END=911 /DNA_ORIENTATION=-
MKDSFGIDGTGSLQFAQRGGKATMVRINLDGTDNTKDRGFAFKVQEFGLLRGENGDCVDLGDEFNPLLEKDKMNRFNPFQDPTRGRIGDITTDGDGKVSTLVQKNVLVNLSGPDSIIGRSVGIYNSGYDSDNVTLKDKTAADCCVIGYDKVDADEVTPHHHHYVGLGTTSTSSTGLNAPYTPYTVPVSQYTSTKPITYVAPTPVYTYGSSYTGYPSYPYAGY